MIRIFLSKDQFLTASAWKESHSVAPHTATVLYFFLNARSMECSPSFGLSAHELIHAPEKKLKIWICDSFKWTYLYLLIWKLDFPLLVSHLDQLQYLLEIECRRKTFLIRICNHLVRKGNLKYSCYHKVIQVYGQDRNFGTEIIPINVRTIVATKVSVTSNNLPSLLKPDKTRIFTGQVPLIVWVLWHHRTFLGHSSTKSFFKSNFLDVYSITQYCKPNDKSITYVYWN